MVFRSANDINAILISVRRHRIGGDVAGQIEYHLGRFQVDSKTRANPHARSVRTTGYNPHIATAHKSLQSIEKGPPSPRSLGLRRHEQARQPAARLAL
jgi:hypothetical protein